MRSVLYSQLSFHRSCSGAVGGAAALFLAVVYSTDRLSAKINHGTPKWQSQNHLFFCPPPCVVVGREAGEVVGYKSEITCFSYLSTSPCLSFRSFRSPQN